MNREAILSISLGVVDDTQRTKKRQRTNAQLGMLDPRPLQKRRLDVCIYVYMFFIYVVYIEILHKLEFKYRYKAVIDIVTLLGEA